MKAIITLEQSLSFDPQIIRHASRQAAEAHMEERLQEEGWTLLERKSAARKGSPVLIEDNGDDHTIEIKELEP